MMNTEPGQATVLNSEVEDHHCFGCGKLNPHGLHLELVPDPDGEGVKAAFIPDRFAEGYNGMVHGGIITTVLDEVMAWALYRKQIWAVTGELTTRYRKPVVLGEPTTARGEIVQDRGRVITMRGEIRRDADRVLLAEATATFVRVPERQRQEWEARYGAIGQDQTTAGGETA